MDRANQSRARLSALWDAVVSARHGSSADVSVWRCKLPNLDTDQLDACVCLGWLTLDERATAGRRATPELSSGFGARRVLRRLVVAANLDLTPAEVRVDAWCPGCGGSGHGRPFVASPAVGLLQLSTSYAAGHAMIALSQVSVGIDVESVDQGETAQVARMASLAQPWRLVAEACPQGSSPLEVWTALEALSKTTGRGLAAAEQEIERAIEGHRLDWITDQPGLVTCLATSAAGATVAVVDPNLCGV